MKRDEMCELVFDGYAARRVIDLREETLKKYLSLVN